jgi:hypothetical protein
MVVCFRRDRVLRWLEEEGAFVEQRAVAHRHRATRSTSSRLRPSK